MLPMNRESTAGGRASWRGGATLAACLVLLAACHRPPPPPAQPGHGAHAPLPPGKGRIVLLPDSAIVVQPGSVEDQLARFLASGRPPPRTFRFTGTEFASWASTPTPQTLRTMYALVQILRAYPHVAVTITGYTDNDGSDERNRVLATARAQRLADLLEQGGVRSPRITVVGAGAVDFIADNATEAGRARNRRVELTVTRI